MGKAYDPISYDDFRFVLARHDDGRYWYILLEGGCDVGVGPRYSIADRKIVLGHARAHLRRERMNRRRCHV
jgi:hypothetical protein